MIAVFVLVSLIMLVLLLVLVPMIGRQLVSLYGLTPQLIDWLQDSALPWLQLQLGISAKIDSLDSIKQMFSENLGKTTDVMQMLLAKITASSVVFRLAG